jgi:hypothetical protein
MKDNQIDLLTARFSFKTNDQAIEAYYTLDRGTWGGADYRFWTLRMEGGYLKREYNQGTSSYKTTLMVLKANTGGKEHRWYEKVLAIDGTTPANSSNV